MRTWILFFGLVTSLAIQFPCARAADVPSETSEGAAEEPDRKIEYKRANDSPLYLHLFESSVSADNSNRPAVVFYFGGGWKGGQPSQFYHQSRELAQLGCLALCVEYRVYSRDEAKVVDCVADAQDAMVFVRKNAASLRIDPDRIVAAGGSAGGHLAAAVATLAYRGEQIDVTPADYRPNGLILFNPAVALADFDGAKEEAYFNKTELVERLGDKPEALSPLHHVTPELPPTLILHGEADITVPIWTVEAFRERATNAGVDCLLVAYPDQVHGFFNFGKAGYEPTLESMLQFLRDKKFMHALPE